MKKVKIRIGFTDMEFIPMPLEEVRKIEDRIDKKLRPILKKLKMNRLKAEQELGKVIINT